MILDRVGPGVRAPDEINVIIEIPMRGEPVKYEIDKATGAIFVDRFLEVSMVYPCNYGYVPHTLAEDGDPVDVLVPTPVPLIAGSVIRCRPVGLLEMEDESGGDAKVLAVPIEKVYAKYGHIQKYTDLSPGLIERITHFFQHYKDLDKGKWVKLRGWRTAAAAKREIRASLKRFNEASPQPNY
ncbi:MAG: inorganic diphosphatase [Gammaproteobacteria bacterium]